MISFRYYNNLDWSLFYRGWDAHIYVGVVTLVIVVLHKVRGLVVGTSNSIDDFDSWIGSWFIFFQSTK